MTGTVADLRSGVARLILRASILALPLLVLLVLYVVFDPFQVVHRNIDYQMRHGVAPNRDAMNTELLLRQTPAVPYDAFILGNSRSLAFHGRDWAKWISPARPFHYDAAAESLFGLRGKVRLMERMGIAPLHVLIILDAFLLKETEDSDNIVTIKHPEVSGGSTLRFHAVFLRTFFSDLFPLKYFDYRLFGTYRPYMEGAISPLRFTRDADTNDSFFTGVEEEIGSRPDLFYAPSRWQSIDRTPRDGDPVVGALQVEMLREIRATFARQRTAYRVVVSPSFSRLRLHPSDATLLREIFGADRVHDFSGDPALGLDLHSWYDDAHYRPTLAREMLGRIYGPR